MFAIITPGPDLRRLCRAHEVQQHAALLDRLAAGGLLPAGPHGLGQGRLVQRVPADGSIPALDFAGGTVVHISSGVSALVCAPGAGQAPRLRQRCRCRRTAWCSASSARPCCGSAGLASTPAAPSAPAAWPAARSSPRTSPRAAAALGWLFVEWIKTGKPTVLGAISGAVAGLVVITPASGFTTPMYALVMGVIGGVVCFFAATVAQAQVRLRRLARRLRRPRRRRHARALILTGVFAVAAVNSAIARQVSRASLDRQPEQVVNQLIADGHHLGARGRRRRSSC